MINFFKDHPFATGTAITSFTIGPATTCAQTSNWYLHDKAQIRINRAILNSGGITRTERKSLVNHTLRRVAKTATLETVGKAAKTVRQGSLILLVCIAVNDYFK